MTQKIGDSSENRPAVVVTHSGSFHADDVFAVATLRLLLGDIHVVRTRDPEIIATGDYVVDVGQTYDASARRFDHHQIGKAGERSNGIPYAAFGLVWKEYGSQVSGSQESAEFIDQRIVQVIDAVDNGVELSVPKLDDVFPHSINNLIHAFLPTWKEDDSDQAYDNAFMYVVDAAEVYLRRVITIAEHMLEASQRVEEMYVRSDDKRIIELDQRYPWHEVLSKHPEPLFVVYPRAEGNWGLKCVRHDTGSFKNRKDLPEAWAGKRDNDFVSITGVSDAIFCHNNRFMAVAGSRDGALELARLALDA